MTTPAMARRRAKEALAFAREHDEHRPSTMAALAALEEVFHYVETVELRLGQHFNGGKLCACCGRPINRKRPAIASVTRGEKREGCWCQDCWDNDPRAVEQYRGIGGPTQHAAIVSYVTTAGSPDRLPSSFRQMIKSFVHKRDLK